MKDIKNFLTEASYDSMTCDREQPWRPNSEWIWVNSEQMYYGFMSKGDVESLNDWCMSYGAEIEYEATFKKVIYENNERKNP